MVTLINALLNVSRIEMGTLSIDPAPTDIIETCKNNIEELKHQIKKKKIKLITHFDKKTPIIAIPILFRV